MARAMVVNRFLAAGVGALLFASTAVAAPTKTAMKAAPRAAHVQPRTVTPAKPTPTKPAPAKAAPTKPEPPTTDATLMIEYQRVFRDLKKLEDLRGADCVKDLWVEYREIKPAELCKTAEGKVDLESWLKDLHVRIERKRGVELSQACLDNPLAASCQ
jgi:hypothetical protein